MHSEEFSVLHRQRAADFERDAQIHEMTAAIRKARQLDRIAALISTFAKWNDRLALRLSARARTWRARVL